MKFLYNLMRAYRIATTELQYADTYEGPEIWTIEDVNCFRNFINTPSGQKLMKRLVNMVFKSAVASTEQPNNTAYNAGVSRGVALAVNSFQEHFLPRAQRGLSAPSDTVK